MKFTRHSAAAALFAASLAASFAMSPAVAATPSFGAGEGPPAGAPEAGPGGPDGRGPGPDGHRPEHGPGFGPGHDFGGPGPGAPGPGMPFARLHGLKLTEAQQDKLFAILHAQAPQRREQDKAMRKAAQALRELGRAERFDEARAAALSRELGQAVAAEALLRARTEAQVLALLNPGQRAQLRQREADRKERAEQRRGPGPDGGPGRDGDPAAARPAPQGRG